MIVEHAFSVGRSLDEVWRFFGDIEAVAACLPGASIATVDGGAVTGTVNVKLGPMDLDFEGEATVHRDDSSRTGTVTGKGADRRGGSRGTMSITYKVSEEDGGSSVAVVADIVLAGPAAQFGRTGLVEEIARRLSAEFAECLEARLEATPASASSIQAGEVKGMRLVFGAFLSWVSKAVRRLFGRSGV